jgi:hypothetical protein
MVWIGEASPGTVRQAWQGVVRYGRSGFGMAWRGRPGQWGRFYGGGPFPHPRQHGGPSATPIANGPLPPRNPKVPLSPPADATGFYAHSCPANRAPAAHVASHTRTGIAKPAVAHTPPVTASATQPLAHHGHDSNSASQNGDRFHRRA